VNTSQSFLNLYAATFEGVRVGVGVVVEVGVKVGVTLGVFEVVGVFVGVGVLVGVGQDVVAITFNLFTPVLCLV
jgi:hypothetical protein